MKQILEHHAELRFWMPKQCVGENEQTRLSFRLHYYICGNEMRNRENSEMRTFHEKWNRKMYTRHTHETATTTCTAHKNYAKIYIWKKKETNRSSITKQPKVEESLRHSNWPRHSTRYISAAMVMCVTCCCLSCWQAVPGVLHFAHNDSDDAAKMNVWKWTWKLAS